MRSLVWGFVVVASLISYVTATGTDDRAYPPLNAGTFSNPAANFRPRFRYWVPDASVNLTHLAYDIADAGSKGAGGVEVLGYYLYGDVGYGGTNGAPVQVDWTKYGWGTQSWRDVQDTALKATKENSMIIDFTIGPNQGAGVPAEPDAEGLLWDLTGFNITLADGNFDGVLPGWGTGSLVSASTGLVTSTVNQSYPYFEYGEQYTYYALFSTIKSDTLQDVTTNVSDDGHLTFRAPANTVSANYTLFVYYLVRSEFRESGSSAEVEVVVPQSPVENYVQNGSWLVDHFSSTGAQVIIDFWEDYLLNGSDTKDTLKEVGNYLWEDSMEFGQAVYMFWTPNLPKAFLANRGYNINKYLPLFFHESTSLQPQPFYVTDESDNGASHVVDYRQTLSELYGEYLEMLTKWANSLGVQFSAQVAYNLPMDMLQTMPIVNGPEIESLGFQHNIDWYRQAAGPNFLAGKRLVSSELGANRHEAYQQTLPEMLWDIKRSIAGSINNFILHGMPYSGDYPNTTWPSFTTFVYQFSAMHGRHEPAWDFYKDFLDYTARLQYLFQNSTPMIDLAFYLKDVDFRALHDRYGPGFHAPFAPNDLENAGFTWHYIGPDNFAFPHAFVNNSILAPEAQSFKALVVRGNDTMTVFGVQKIREYATQGLPVVFSGGIPSTVSGYQPNATSYVNSTLASILSLPNVHQVGYDGLASSLVSLGIAPRVAVSSNATQGWFTQWHNDRTKNVDYVYVYNDGTSLELGEGYSEGNVTVETSGTPFWYDTWAGETKPVLVYSQNCNFTTIPLQLKGNQTVVIGFRHDNASLPYINSTLTPYYSTNKSILVSAEDSPAIVPLSNGSLISFAPPSTPATTLGSWSLIIESWTAPSNSTDIATTAVKTNLTSLTLPTLVAWSKISPSLQNVSGRGYYNTDFIWSKSNGASNSTFPTGAFLDLGAIFHTAKVTVNGIPLPPLDVSWPRIEIGSLLKAGQNSVEIVVATPLGNVLRPGWGELMTSGKVPQSDPPGLAEYGLVKDARIVPYVEYILT